MRTLAREFLLVVAAAVAIACVVAGCDGRGNSDGSGMSGTGAAPSGAAGETGLDGGTGGPGNPGDAGNAGSGGVSGTGGGAGAGSNATDAGGGSGTGGTAAAGSGGAGAMALDGGADRGGDGGVSGSGDAGTGTGGGTGNAPAGLVFGPYKDTSINLDWNTNVISTMVSGSRTALASDLPASGGKTVTLAFATGECGSENWGGVPGAMMAQTNAGMLAGASIDYILSTGGAAGSFTCGSDADFATFVDRWASPHLIGVDFDIEAGQSQAVIGALIERIGAAHARYPALRFSLTLATLANNDGSPTAHPLGAAAQDSFNTYGDSTLEAVRATLGFDGSAASWPSYLALNLMAMDYGAPSPGVCVVANGVCDMGQSAIQAAYNLHDVWGVPYANIELTPMIGGNDVSSEQFTLADTDTITQFAIAQGLAGVHYWSYDRDIDCPPGSASPTCNSLGGAGAHGFLQRFLGGGLR